MPTSLLTQYIEITKLLMEYGPQTISQISSFFRNLNSADLERVLDFLSESKIITRESTDVNLRYAVTERGIGVLTFFKVKPSRPTIKLKR
jgi:hypothetical protein